MSALPPKAHIVERDRHVRFVPLAEVASPHSITSLGRFSSRMMTRPGGSAANGAVLRGLAWPLRDECRAEYLRLSCLVL